MAVLREDIVKITYDVDSGPLSEVGSAVDSVMSETESAVKQTENAVTECIDRMADSFDNGTEAGSGMASAADMVRDKMTDLGSAIKNKAVSALQNLGAKAKALPGNALKGLVSGLKSVGSAALGAAKKK